MPQRHAEALTTLPRLAALFHNDCLLLAHACLGPLVHAYRHKLPAPLNRTATCVDLAPALRSLGEQALLRQLAVQQVGVLGVCNYMCDMYHCEKPCVKSCLCVHARLHLRGIRFFCILCFNTSACLPATSVVTLTFARIRCRWLIWQVQLDEFLKGVVWVPNDDEDEEGSDNEGRDGNAATNTPASSPEQAIAQCLFHLHHLANLWQPVLSPEVCLVLPLLSF